MKHRIAAAFAVLSMLVAVGRISYVAGVMATDAPERIEVGPRWAAPEVVPGDDFYSYCLPFAMGGERYLAVFNHRTEDVFPIAGWAVKVNSVDPEIEAAKARWLMKNWLLAPGQVSVPRPSAVDLAQFDRD